MTLAERRRTTYQLGHAGGLRRRRRNAPQIGSDGADGRRQLPPYDGRVGRFGVKVGARDRVLGMVQAQQAVPAPSMLYASTKAGAAKQGRMRRVDIRPPVQRALVRTPAGGGSHGGGTGGGGRLAALLAARSHRAMVFRAAPRRTETRARPSSSDCRPFQCPPLTRAGGTSGLQARGLRPEPRPPARRPSEVSVRVDRSPMPLSWRSYEVMGESEKIGAFAASRLGLRLPPGGRPKFSPILSTSSHPPTTQQSPTHPPLLPPKA